MRFRRAAPRVPSISGECACLLSRMSWVRVPGDTLRRVPTAAVDPVLIRATRVRLPHAIRHVRFCQRSGGRPFMPKTRVRLPHRIRYAPDKGLERSATNRVDPVRLWAGVPCVAIWDQIGFQNRSAGFDSSAARRIGCRARGRFICGSVRVRFSTMRRVGSHRSPVQATSDPTWRGGSLVGE